MNRRIYYDGALINKIGIDRIVIKKVVLKEINAEKLDTALTCCAIHYDKVIVEGRQFYLTEKDNKFNYLKIDDNELGTLTFGVKNKQYGIYQFSPKEMWGGTNLVNYSAKEIHEFIEDAIPACHAGYFAQDNSDSDEAIANEVADILHNKKGLISLRKEDGSFNTRRFLFSKWTLKEGWDNPNVFTIAKLRSSGSDNSKLQEVGRGLRLPVDENGNRISNEEFKLNYIVDFTEADFAERLVDEINGELPETLTLSQDALDKVAKERDVDPDDLFIELMSKKYIK